MGDWLGTGNRWPKDRIFRPFVQARDYARGLGLKSLREWKNHCRSGEKPSDIPSSPHAEYRTTGWVDWADWLSTKNKRPGWGITYKGFDEAREFVHRLGIRGAKAWREYCKLGDKPDDIPSSPNSVYKDRGWIGWADWLGNGVHTKNIEFKTFVEARKFVRGLNLKSAEVWRQYSKSGERPSDIPSAPDKTYKDKGWISWPDWLGTSK